MKIQACPNCGEASDTTENKRDWQYDYLIECPYCEVYSNELEWA